MHFSKTWLTTIFIHNLSFLQIWIYVSSYLIMTFGRQRQKGEERRQEDISLKFYVKLIQYIIKNIIYKFFKCFGFFLSSFINYHTLWSYIINKDKVFHVFCSYRLMANLPKTTFLWIYVNNYVLLLNYIKIYKEWNMFHSL